MLQMFSLLPLALSIFVFKKAEFYRAVFTDLFCALGFDSWDWRASSAPYWPWGLRQLT